MAFKIRCENVKCFEIESISDGYNNKGDISIRVVGEDTVEIHCKSCGDKVYITDGLDVLYVGASGFRIKSPDVTVPLKFKETSKKLIASLPNLPADEHLSLQQAINEAAKIQSVREANQIMCVDMAIEKLKAREKEILKSELFGDDDQ